MYSFLEIEAIFKSCNNWDDLEKACELFLIWVVPDGGLSPEKMSFVGEVSLRRFAEIEKL